VGRKGLYELLRTLEAIAFLKSMLPLHLRGWINSLGLYVQACEAGQRTRLQAGGNLHSYLDVWQEGQGDWQIRKFDGDTWERRFAHVVEPTYQIADFLSDRVASFGDLDSEGANVLSHALQHYKDTGVWLGLPKIPEEVMRKLAEEKARARAQEERQKRLRRITDVEAEVRKNPLDRLAWLSLPFLYYQEQRFKDMENALKMQLKIKGGPYSSTYKELGKTYLAVLSVSLRGKGIPILGYEPSNVTVETLGYSIDELRDLARENLSKAYEMDKEAGFKEEDLKELELALKATYTPSLEVFDELDRYLEQERQLDERKQEERLQGSPDSDTGEDE